MAGDRFDFLNIFSVNSTIEVPVGTSFYGRDGASKFWDTYIEANNHTYAHSFHIVSEGWNDVIVYTNLTLSDSLNSSSLYTQPALYKFKLSCYPYYIDSVQGYYSLLNRTAGELSFLPTATNLVKNLRMTNTFNGGLSIGDTGKLWAIQFFQNMVSKDEASWMKLFTNKTLKQLVVTFLNRKNPYSGDTQSLEYFWRGFTLYQYRNFQILFNENDVFVAGNSVVGIFKIQIDDRAVNCACVFDFVNSSLNGPQIDNISMWIDSIKFN